MKTMCLMDCSEPPKVAVTELDAPIETVHVLDPRHAPPQPVNVELELPSGVAVSATWLLAGKLAAQLAPQLIPAGLLVTVPVPGPKRITVN